MSDGAVAQFVVRQPSLRGKKSHGKWGNTGNDFPLFWQVEGQMRGGEQHRIEGH